MLSKNWSVNRSVSGELEFLESEYKILVGDGEGEQRVTPVLTKMPQWNTSLYMLA